jgi:hypothetical protein
MYSAGMDQGDEWANIQATRLYKSHVEATWVPIQDIEAMRLDR